MDSPQTPIDELKGKMRRTWMEGDFGQIAKYSAKGAEEFVRRLSIVPGMRVLDVACGTGNLAIPAAREGAEVTGIDIAPNLLEQAKQRAASEDLKVTFEEGDAEQLPFPDEHFDLVMSMFGAMFAPRPDRVVSELVRVCRKGGTIAMANWTPTGSTGKMFALNAQHVPPPPGVPLPALWGNEATVRQRFDAHVSSLHMEKRPFSMEFPFSPRETVEFFRKYFGPTAVAFAKLEGSAQAAYADDLERFWEEANVAQDGSTKIPNEYLEVVATRA